MSSKTSGSKTATSPKKPRKPNPTTGSTKTAAPRTGATPKVAPTTQPAATRRVRLLVSRVDPWSVMKLAFLLSVSLGIILVVAVAILWSVLNGMGVWNQLNTITSEITDSEQFDIATFVSLSRVVAGATVVAVANVVLMTAMATLGAVIYNITAQLVGGLQVTLSDD